MRLLKGVGNSRSIGLHVRARELEPIEVLKYIGEAYIGLYIG